MIFPWNRKEVFLGSSMADFCRARSILAENHIPYDFRVVDHSARQRSYGHSLAAGNEGQSVMYYVYVNKRDYETAEDLLRENRHSKPT
jgi:hypothetical protein